MNFNYLPLSSDSLTKEFSSRWLISTLLRSKIFVNRWPIDSCKKLWLDKTSLQRDLEAEKIVKSINSDEILSLSVVNIEDRRLQAFSFTKTTWLHFWLSSLNISDSIYLYNYLFKITYNEEIKIMWSRIVWRFLEIEGWVIELIMYDSVLTLEENALSTFFGLNLMRLWIEWIQ